MSWQMAHFVYANLLPLGIGLIMMLIVKEDKRRTRAGTQKVVDEFKNKRAEESSTDGKQILPSKLPHSQIQEQQSVNSPFMRDPLILTP